MHPCPSDSISEWSSAAHHPDGRTQPRSFFRQPSDLILEGWRSWEVADKLESCCHIFSEAAWAGDDVVAAAICRVSLWKSEIV